MKLCSVDDCPKASATMGYCPMHYKRLRVHGSTEYVKPSAEARFWSKVNKSSSCWLWIAGKDSDGYGQFSIGFKKLKPHRYAYELAHGPIQEGLVIDHKCHVRACVRPSHLRAVTQKQNVENRSALPPKALSGFTGVHWVEKTGKWVVNVKHNQKAHYGGSYSDRLEAAEAARQLRLSLFTHNDLDRRTA